MTIKEYFPTVGKIKFEGKESKNPFSFRYYDAEKVVYGRKMKDWFKFSMAYWHTLCAEGSDQFGGPTKIFRGMKEKMHWKEPKTKWMLVLNSCKRLVSIIIVSMISI